MNLWAVLPVKSLNLAKSRLRGMLDQEQVQRLMMYLFEKTLRALKACCEIRKILVISADEKIIKTAQDQQTTYIQETYSPGLNRSLTAGIKKAVENGAEGVLIVPADLSQINTEEINRILTASFPSPCLTIVPDQFLQGTNLMLLSPPELISPAFGKQSLNRHINLGLQAGADISIFHSQTLNLDLDHPEDFLDHFSEEEML